MEHAKAIAITDNKIVALALIYENSSSIYSKEIRVMFEEKLETHTLIIRTLFHKWLIQFPVWQYIILFRYLNRNILTHFQPDLIHANVIFPCGIIGYWLSIKFGLPLVISEHWSKFEYFLNRSLWSRWGRKALKYSSAITCVSPLLKEQIVKETKDPLKISIIPNVVDNTVFSFKPKVSNGELKFLTAATWAKPKLPFLIFDALEVFRKNIKSLKLQIIGGGKLIPQMRARAATLSFKVEFLGSKPKLELASYMQECDYFLHASAFETFGIVVAEALSTGTPVIVSDIESLGLFVNETNGVKCSNNLNAWVSGLSKLTQTKYNHEEISKNSGSSFSHEKIGKEFLKVYQKII